MERVVADFEKLEAGAIAPNFELLNQDGEKVSLEGYQGSKVIVYFYPAASTPGCTTEACEFNDNLNSLKAAGYHVLGISPDEPKKLAKFKEKEGLNFPLLSDPDMAVHKRWGAFGEKSLYGRLYKGVLRSTFAVDEKGKVTLAMYSVRAKGHVASLRTALGI